MDSVPPPHDREPDDDDALSWEGDEELGRFTSLTERGAAPASAPVAAAESGDLERMPGADHPEQAAASAGSRVGTVLFGIAYLAWTVGWIFAIQEFGAVIAPTTGVGWVDFVSRIAQFLALVSAPLWFAATLQLTRGSAPRHRLGWLALGLGVLIPWPFVIGLLS